MGLGSSLLRRLASGRRSRPARPPTVWPDAARARYAVALASVAAATVLRYGLSTAFATAVPPILDYAVLAAVGYVCGLAPAVAALVVSATAAAYVDPIPMHEEWVGLSLHIIVGIMAGSFGDAHRRARAAMNESRRAAERAAFLADAGNLLAATLDYDTTLASIARLAVPFLGDWCSVDGLGDDGSVRRVAITHADPSKTSLARVASTFMPDPEHRHPRTGVIETGRSVLITEVTDATLIAIANDQRHLEALRAFGYRSAMFVALRARDRTLGVITLATAESGRRYDRRDLAFAEELAARAGLALDNASLYRAAQVEIAGRVRTAQRLHAQHDITRVLSEAASLTEAMPRILAAIGEHLVAEWAALWRVDEQASVLRCAETWHATDESFAAFETASRSRTFASGEGLPGRVWQHGAATWIPDVAHDPNFPRAQFAERVGFRGGFAFPLLLGREVLGVMEFFSRNDREPDQGLRDLMASVGHQIGQFIERKDAEAAARVSEERMQAVFDSALDAIITIDAAGRVMEINAAGERMFGLDRESVRGKEMAALVIPPELRERHRAGLARHLATGTRSVIGRRTELTALRADGTTFAVEVAIARVGSGNRPLFTGFLRDITATKAAERERADLLERERTARAEAEEANRIKDEFLATVSHELRTPLTPILIWTRMLRSGRLDTETAARGVATIENSAKAQVQLIEDLLDVSRIITGKLRMKRESFELAPVIHAAIQSVRLAAEAKGVEVSVDLDPAAGVLFGDPNRLQQVVWNLLSNAIKFTPAGGHVEIGLVRAAGAIELTVSDTGKGISESFLPHVFDRFRQADSSTTRAHGGLGLGLAIVRHLVEQHGGTVEATSPGENRGARFTVRLPAPMDAPLRPDESATPSVPPSNALAGTRVLAVDDDPDTCTALAMLLESHGADVRTAQSADDALRALRAWHADVVVSDIAMPDVDGYELLQRLQRFEREGGVRLPAIALTAQARAEDRASALAAGFAVHLAKPVEPAQLIGAVAALIADAED